MMISPVRVVVGLAIMLTTGPAGAQYRVPSILRPANSVGLRTTLPTDGDAAPATARTVQSEESINGTGLVVAGLVGGAGGLLAGAAVGREIAAGCHGEFCGLGPLILGGLIGESFGLALGAHLGSGSTRGDRLALSTLAAAGIMTGTVLASLGGGVVILPLAPLLQLASVYAIETH
ncbi:MAG: hypothetical protein ABJE47_13695 [bacterium]